MKKTYLYLAAALVLSATNVATAQTGDEIIAKHIDAIGGEKNWDKVKSIKMTGSTNMQGMDIAMEITVLDKKAMRTNISVMGMDGYIIITEAGGWMYMPFQPGMDKVTPIPADQAKRMAGNMSIKSAQLADKSVITSAKFAGRDTLDNVPCLKVVITGTDGAEQTAYFDAATYYMVRAERKTVVNDEEQEVAFSYSNFQKLPEGVVVPMTQSNPALGGDVNFKKVEVNQKVADNYFKPEEPKADNAKSKNEGGAAKKPATKK